MADRIRVLIVDDHAVVREGLQVLLGEEASLSLVGQAGSVQEALRLCNSLEPDVVLVDLVLPDGTGIELTRRLREQLPRTQVVILTGSIAADASVKEALDVGAIGYWLKDVLRMDLVQAIQRAAQGKVTLHPEAQEQLLQFSRKPLTALEQLTPRERDVLKLLASGCSNKKIASLLAISEGTVKGYVSTILEKLNVSDRTQAALYAVRHGVPSVD